MRDDISDFEFNNIIGSCQMSDSDLARLNVYLRSDTLQSVMALKSLFYIEQFLFSDGNSAVLFIAKETDEGSHDRADFVRNVLEAAERHVLTELANNRGYKIILAESSDKRISGLSIVANFNRAPDPSKLKHDQTENDFLYRTFLNVLEKIRRFYNVPVLKIGDPNDHINL